MRVIQLVLLRYDVFGVLEPGLEADFEVHARQERVVGIALVDELVVHHLVVDLLLGVDSVEDAVLGRQLDDLVLAVHLQRAILTLHAPVEQLVKVDVAVVAADSHLKHVPFLVLCLDIPSEADGVLARS